MKKILVFTLAGMLIFSGCGKKVQTPTATPTPTTGKTTASQYPDKINETTYAGRVTEITDTTITIIMDEETYETFDLNDRAKRDIDILKIAVDSRVIIEFDDPETRVITAVQAIRSEI